MTEKERTECTVDIHPEKIPLRLHTFFHDYLHAKQEGDDWRRIYLKWKEFTVLPQVTARKMTVILSRVYREPDDAEVHLANEWIHQYEDRECAYQELVRCIQERIDYEQHVLHGETHRFFTYVRSHPEEMFRYIPKFNPAMVWSHDVRVKLSEDKNCAYPYRQRLLDRAEQLDLTMDCMNELITHH